ncbi:MULTISPECIES: hypothetical protein [Coprobacillaceae]|uniref:hypothetical protein n=1 Tax=Coprobacillaceae TaxID=2810280 RepID=UPI000E4FAE51|nr:MULTISPECIES: hypothetical protein [Coprobacillaceae]RHM60871.1 hypothetical protein DWZ53_06105 [Coprobacillus sp. AF33-1AC]RHS94514.1 hypothetical protein DW911_05110 [Erysipelatoclostridium sp. AM42-17]
MDNRQLKKDCYLDLLDDAIVDVEAIYNQLNRLAANNQTIDEKVIKKDKIKTKYQLELSLASLCILLRKMAENMFIQLPAEIRKDMNSIIHSNRFEFDDQDIIYVYSQKGKEEVSLKGLLLFARSVL